MSYTIEMIREISKGDIIEHHTKNGIYRYTVLGVSEQEGQPINLKLDYTPFKLAGSEEEEEDE